MIKTKGKILIVDDDRDVLETARMFLKQHFTEIDIASDPAEINGLISRKEYDLILLDMNFRKGRNDGKEGFYWLSRILEYDPDAVVVFITAYGEIDLAVNAIKEGATDFILKPWKNQKLLATVSSGIKMRRSKKEVTRLKSHEKIQRKADVSPLDLIIGDSDTAQKMKSMISKVAQTDANVLILGENGTGKGLVAQAIHNLSNRNNESFIKVDLGATVESLFESELFGHVKGAFTDAKEDRAGSIELAEKGTLFLDEIGNIPSNLQAKMLTVLENRRIKRVGANQEKDVDIRLISATNKNLENLVKSKEFREDLLYRLNTIEIVVPPLRERKEDIPLIVEYYLDQYKRRYQKPELSISEKLLEDLKKYDWPGNIRELLHATERAVILSESNKISDLSLFVKNTQEITSGEKPKTLDEAERQFILQSLRENGGNVTQTAQSLGLTRTALYRRMNKHGI